MHAGILAYWCGVFYFNSESENPHILIDFKRWYWKLFLIKATWSSYQIPDFLRQQQCKNLQNHHKQSCLIQYQCGHQEQLLVPLISLPWVWEIFLPVVVQTFFDLQFSPISVWNYHFAKKIQPICIPSMELNPLMIFKYVFKLFSKWQFPRLVFAFSLWIERIPYW